MVLTSRVAFLLVLFLSGCAARSHRVAVPGCKNILVDPPHGCVVWKLKDHLEMHCDKQVIVNGKIRTEDTPQTIRCKID